MDLMSGLAFEILLNYISSIITPCGAFALTLQAMTVVAKTTLFKHSWSECLVSTRVQMNHANQTDTTELVLTKPNRFPVNDAIR